MNDVDEEISKGERYLNKLDYERAYRHFDRATKMDGTNALAYFGKAESAIGIPKVRKEKIGTWYKKAIELDPSNPQYLEAYALYCMNDGHFNEAEKFFKDAANADPENAPFYYTEFAIQYCSTAPVLMGQYMDDQTKDMIVSKALRYLLKAINLEPKEAVRLLK
ncbi:MAG: tetratricopeptide repeat protein [Thermoplasmata archaeon]